MGKHETVVAYDPPMPTARDVRARRRRLEASLDALKASRAGLALASAKGDTAAQVALAALYLKIRTAEFEIECNDLAFELANSEDGTATVAWRAAILTLPPEEVIAGIGQDGCCRHCTSGYGGCVLSAGKSPTCMHPIREKHCFGINDTGQKVFRYRDDPQASAIFDAALKKLKLRRGSRVGDFE